MATVTIKPTTDTGFIKLTITTTSANKGKLAVENWKKGTPPAKDKLEKKEEHSIINAKADASKKKITGKIDLIFPLSDPDLTVTLNDAQKSVGVQVVGLGAQNTTYKLTDGDYKEITKFVAAAFP